MQGDVLFVAFHPLFSASTVYQGLRAGNFSAFLPLLPMEANLCLLSCGESCPGWDVLPSSSGKRLLVGSRPGTVSCPLLGRDLSAMGFCLCSWDSKVCCLCSSNLSVLFHMRESLGRVTALCTFPHIVTGPLLHTCTPKGGSLYSLSPPLVFLMNPGKVHERSLKVC